MPAIPTLWPFQMEGALAIRAFGGRALLADEMGLGKTIQALYWLWRSKSARPCVVVCPASVKYNWEREAKRFGLLAEVLEGTTPPRRQPQVHAPLYIINYEILRYWRKWLRRMGIQVVILDECHYIKNQDSKRFKSCNALCAGVPHVIALSGTPLTNRPAELWPTLHILMPEKYNSFFTYAVRYCKPKRLPWGWSYMGAKHLPELHANLKSECMIRRLKKDVLPELPDKQRYPAVVEIRDRHEYNEAANDFLGWLRRTSPAKAKKASRAESVVKVGYLLRLAAKLKTKAVISWIEDFLEKSDGKLIVFTVHRKRITSLEKHFHKELWTTVDGRVKGRDRLAACDRFQHDARTRLFFGNSRAAGIGLTLTAATTVLVADLPWTPGELGQSEDRAHRFGQTKEVSVYYIVARDTIEEDLCDTLRDKQEVLDAVLDGRQGVNDLDILGELLKKMYRKPLLAA
jgi:SWI/SNF-related matrix-associated actin-dependent regulator 1 of chromatin subfamily A